MDNTIHYDIPTIAKAFSEHIHTGASVLPKSDAASVLEFLYIAYTEVQASDPPHINEGFKRLGDHLEQLPLDENNAIFSIVCELCDAYEKRAFMDAIRLGAYLALELQE